MKRFTQRLLFAACVSALGCGDDTDGDTRQLDASANTDAASADADDHTDEEVPCDATYPSFTPGMSVQAGALTVKLQSISPTPPRQLQRNNWQLQILDASGQPVSGLTLASISSYMPVHMHGGRRTPVATAGSDPGTYQLAGIDFIMRGPWQVLFEVQQNGSTAGRATIQICVE